MHLVRHGQSEYNAAMFAQGDPRIVDAPLTKQGQEQVCAHMPMFATAHDPLHASVHEPWSQM